MKAKRISGWKKSAIVCFVLQAVALFGSLMQQQPIFLRSGTGFWSICGMAVQAIVYFSIAIVGVVLWAIGARREAERDN